MTGNTVDFIVGVLHRALLHYGECYLAIIRSKEMLALELPLPLCIVLYLSTQSGSLALMIKVSAIDRRLVLVDSYIAADRSTGQCRRQG